MSTVIISAKDANIIKILRSKISNLAELNYYNFMSNMLLRFENLNCCSVDFCR